VPPLCFDVLIRRQFFQLTFFNESDAPLEMEVERGAVARKADALPTSANKAAEVKPCIAALNSRA
jgi:hypothetical protein